MKKASAYFKRRYALPAGILTLAGATIAASAIAGRPDATETEAISATEPADTIAPAKSDSLRYITLTPEDYREVAEELDIPVAAIRAVAEIEAGPKCEGFNADHTPVINFDLNMFKKAARSRGIDLTKYKSTHAVVFNALDKKKYGSIQAAQYARLHAAMEIDTVAALEGTFWGMFQIGGFNWKTCGCSSAQDFAEKMAYSENEQLKLFAAFISNRNLVGYIKKRQWAQFSLRYNGPGYKKRGYDTRMEAAYKKYSR